MRASIPLFVAASLSLTGLVVAEAAAPKVRPAARAFARQPNVPRAKRVVARRVDPQLAAVAVSMLRRFADEAPDPTDLDLAFQQRMKPSATARSSAKRLLARIDALAPATFARTFGKDAKATRGRFSARTVARLAPKAALDFASIWAQPTVVIPAEGVPQPTTLKLVLAGVASTAAGDADGSDEVVVVADWIDVVDPIGTASMPSTGTTALAAGTAVASGNAIFEGLDRPALLVSGVFEDDDGSAASAREDFHTMIQLAQSLAGGLVAADAIAKMELALGTCVGLLEISDPQRFGPGRVVWSRFGGTGTDLHDLYATPASQTGGVAWKTRHDHAFGGGSYEVLFDVPAPPPPDLSKIDVRIVSVSSLTATEHEPPETTTPLDLRMYVQIKGGVGSWAFPHNDNTPSANLTFSRIVQPGPVDIEISLEDVASEADGCWIGGWGSSNCFYFTPLDVHPGAGETAKLHFDPATGTITGDASGKAGDELELEGNASNKPKGRVTVVVSAQ